MYSLCGGASEGQGEKTYLAMYSLGGGVSEGLSLLGGGPYAAPSVIIGVR